MWGHRIAVLAAAGMSLSACNTYRLEKPDQLYVGQAYLPLPSGYPGGELPANAQGGAGCADPPAAPRSVKSRKEFMQPLAGMTLHVTESTYRRDALEAMPVLTEWSWRLPSPAGCKSAAPWSRRDTLMVRHLLSGARLNEPTPDVGYFADMLQGAVCKDGRCAAGQLQTQVFDPVVRNLKIVYRKPQQRDDHPDEPAPPSGVSAPAGYANGLSAWFRDQVVAARDEDLFDGRQTNGQSFADICARLYDKRLATRTVTQTEHDRDQAKAIREALRAPLTAASDNGDVSTASWEKFRAELDRLTTAPASPPGPTGVDGLTIEACNFSYKSLLLQPQDAWPPAPGTQKGDLVLLSTGDPLLLFRPLAHKALLDTSRRDLCPDPSGAAPRGQCKEEAERVSQGFQDFDVTFEVFLQGQRAPVAVTPHVTLADLEARYGDGRRITALRRAPRWVPEHLIVNDLQYKNPDRRLERRAWDKKGALRVVFVPDGSQDKHGVNGVIAWESIKSQVLLAPGDEVVFARPVP